MSAQQAKRNKTDLYASLRANSLDSLRVDVETLIPTDDPMSYLGTRPFFDPWRTKETFIAAPFIEVTKAKRKRSGAALMISAAGAQPGAVDREIETARLKVAKVGVLARKGMCLFVFLMTISLNERILQTTWEKTARNPRAANGKAGV